MQGDLMEKKVMFAVKQDRLDKSIGQVLQDLTIAFLAPLDFIADGLRLYKVFRWVQDVRLRNATIREMYRLNDDYLDDIGIKRGDIRPIVDAMMKRLRERRHQSRCF
jgi:uncharacterized protein YjiS (DUF1127 family)